MLSWVGFSFCRFLMRLLRGWKRRPWVKRFPPGFRDAPRSAKRTRDHGRDDDDHPTPKATQQAGTGALGRMPGCSRERRDHPGWTIGFGTAADPDDPQRGDGAPQPQPGGPRRIGHLGWFPVPSSPVHILEATCNDGTEPVPRPIRRCGDSIGQNQPRGGMVVIPAGPQRARETRRGAGQTGRPTTPSRFPLLHGLDRWAKGDRALRTIGSPRLDPQQGAPARRLDGAIQPLRIPPAIRHHDDRPSRGRSRPDERAPPFPGRPPRPFRGCWQHDPDHRERTAPIDQADRQHGAALARRTRIHSAGRPRCRRGPPGRRPVQERHETCGHIERLTRDPAFGPGCARGLAAPLAQAPAHRRCRASDRRRNRRPPTGDAATWRRRHRKTPQGEDGCLRLRAVRHRP
jgi:hypothetical protein